MCSSTRYDIISFSNDNTTTLCNDTKGGTYLSAKATLFCKWKHLSCPATQCSHRELQWVSDVPVCSCVYTFDMHIDSDSCEMSKTKYQIFKVESL